jgi:acylphosphatase
MSIMEDHNFIEEDDSEGQQSAFFALVQGRVQGVGFRYSAYYEARRLGLSGWVRNTPDGAVEVLAEGRQTGLESFLRWLHRGPPGAWVDSVRHRPQNPSGAYRGFSIEP